MNNFNYTTTTSFDRGYTLHEHYDEFGLINMNGRLYDPAIGRFMQTDPMAEKYYWISPYAYCANNPIKFVDPTGMIIDPSELTKEQQEEFRQAMELTCVSSELFKTMYDAMDKSEIVYRIRIGETNGDVPGQYNSCDNSITFKSAEDMVSADTYMEELFHGYQWGENKSLYESGKEFNYEFEAKVAKLLMTAQAGFLQSNKDGTNLETIFNLLSSDGLDINMHNAQTITENDFHDKYFKGAESFMNWNIKNNYGNNHYRNKTEQTPKSIIKLFTK